MNSKKALMLFGFIFLTLITVNNVSQAAVPANLTVLLRKVSLYNIIPDGALTIELVNSSNQPITYSGYNIPVGVDVVYWSGEQHAVVQPFSTATFNFSGHNFLVFVNESYSNSSSHQLWAQIGVKNLSVVKIPLSFTVPLTKLSINQNLTDGLFKVQLIGLGGVNGEYGNPAFLRIYYNGVLENFTGTIPAFFADEFSFSGHSFIVYMNESYGSLNTYQQWAQIGIENLTSSATSSTTTPSTSTTILSTTSVSTTTVPQSCGSYNTCGGCLATYGYCQWCPETNTCIALGQSGASQCSGGWSVASSSVCSSLSTNTIVPVNVLASCGNYIILEAGNTSHCGLYAITLISVTESTPTAAPTSSCTSYTTCGSCLATYGYCGWCAKSGTCIPWNGHNNTCSGGGVEDLSGADCPSSTYTYSASAIFNVAKNGQSIGDFSIPYESSRTIPGTNLTINLTYVCSTNIKTGTCAGGSWADLSDYTSANVVTSATPITSATTAATTSTTSSVTTTVTAATTILTTSTVTSTHTTTISTTTVPVTIRSITSIPTTTSSTQSTSVQTTTPQTSNPQPNIVQQILGAIVNFFSHL